MSSLVPPHELVNMNSSFPAEALQAGCRRVLVFRVLGFRVLGFRVLGFRVLGFRVLGL